MQNPSTFDLQDLNEGIFDNSAVFNTDEVRSFIFILTPKNPEYTINKYLSEKLG